MGNAKTRVYSSYQRKKGKYKKLFSNGNNYTLLHRHDSTFLIN